MAIKDIVKGICNITRCKYDVYTKERTDELLEAKANSEDVYTKSDIDDSLETKVNKSSITSGTAEPSGGEDGDIYFQYQ